MNTGNVIAKGASTLQEVTNSGATTSNGITFNTTQSNTSYININNSGNTAKIFEFKTSGTGEPLLYLRSSTGSNYILIDGYVGQMVLGGSVIDSKAVLTLTSTQRGFLPPRMTTTQRDAITSPPEGLIVYNITSHTIDFYNGTAWKQIAGA